MKTEPAISTSIKFEHIESAIQSLSVQHRVMIHLLLLQYLEINAEDIDFMAADQPDSRFMAGNQPQGRAISLEAVQNISSRANQYKSYYRQKRERPGMHIEFLQQSLTLVERTARIAEGILKSDFAVSEEAIKSAQAQASTLLLRQEQRKLTRTWNDEEQELAPKDFQHQWLLLEYQSLLRKRSVFKRRLKFSHNEFQTASTSYLKDHEIAHIWGIPLGSLAARKVKALHQFLSLLVQQDNNASPANDSAQPPDYWKETFNVLAQRPIERSIVDYDGLEKTEEQLMGKLEAFINGTMSEPEESKFWTSITRLNDTEHAGTWKSHGRSILAFQRLHALLNDMDLSDEAIRDDLLAKSYPKLPDDQLAPESEEKPVELGEMGLGVLAAFSGEQDDKRRG